MKNRRTAVGWIDLFFRAILEQHEKEERSRVERQERAARAARRSVERFAVERFASAQRMFLRACGWEPSTLDMREDLWWPPVGHYFYRGHQFYARRTGHAVNSQLWVWHNLP